MKKTLLLSTAALLILTPLHVMAGAYKNFKSVAYVMVGTINHMESVDKWESMWSEYSRNLTLDKVYLETYRDQQHVKPEAMEAAIKFFRSKGIEVQGGITYNYSGGNRQRYESFCYSNPENIKEIQKIAEITAGYFDEIVLDDFYFTNCKCDLCISGKEKAGQSWGEFRMDLLDKVARENIVGAAHRVNPKCKVIIKYPNWYDHFHGLGFDLSRGPFTFDGVYTGTETRDPESEQHLQAYESFGIMRYLENIRPQHNFGGWVDTGGALYPDMFAEQLWLTLLSRSPEITLFNFESMAGKFRDGQRPWADLPTSLNLKDLRAVSASRGIDSPSWGRVAQYAYEKIDPVLSKLGKPKGIKAYKPFNSDGEDFLHNYMGMIGIPVEVVPEFPNDGSMVIVTECCKDDPAILDKLKKHLSSGGEVIVTSGFWRAMQDKGIRNIFEMEATDRSADIDTLIVSSAPQQQRIMRSDIPVRIPVFEYYTNDSWEDITTLSYQNGWPMLHYSAYSKGSIFVWVIPDNFSHLYALPANALNRLREVASEDMNVHMEGISRVSLFTYDNDTFVVHSFRDTPVEISLVTRGKGGIEDLETGQIIAGSAPFQSAKVYGRERHEVQRETVTIQPHSFRAFKIRK